MAAIDDVTAATEASGGQEAVGDLTSDELLAGGMSRIEAWIQTPNSKTKRKTRNSRYREQQAASGLTQVSVRIPADLAPALKELASKACETGQLLTSDDVTVQAEKQSPSQTPEIVRQFEEMKSLLVTVSDDLSSALADAQQSNETLRSMLDEARNTEGELRKRLIDLEARDRKQRELVNLGQQISALTGVRGFLIGLLLRVS
jgi:phosphopantetheinyl transferase (holo-ACP synthase)